MRALFTGLASAALAVVPAALGLAAASGSEDPIFLPGDAGSLSASVVDADAVARDVPSTILTVEVENRGERVAEPLAFRVVLEINREDAACFIVSVDRLHILWIEWVGLLAPEGIGHMEFVMVDLGRQIIDLRGKLPLLSHCR